MKIVRKLWGSEKWIANFPEYCGKILTLYKDTQSSLHYHNTKKETFYCLEGQVYLEVGGIKYLLTPHEEPVTINPKQKHMFESLDNKSMIIEISTQHSDEDVVRITESRRIDADTVLHG